MGVELSRRRVGAVGQVALNGLEVHWLLYDFEVVEHAVSFWVDGDQKWKGAFVFFQLRKDEAALRKIVLDGWGFIDGCFPHFLRLILQKLIHLLDAYPLGAAINVLRVLDIARNPR